MLFNLYGDNAMWQLLGWVLVFAVPHVYISQLFVGSAMTGLNKSRRSILFPDLTTCIDSLFYCHRSRRSKRLRMGIKQPDT